MAGYDRSAPQTSPLSSSKLAGAATRRLIPSGTARVRITARVCGCVAASAQNVLRTRPTLSKHIIIASAAAVASSSSDAFAIGSAVSSSTIVW